ncbi:MAG: hypothetical protein ACRYG8_21285 [Janthinobacterium lividum]
MSTFGKAGDYKMLVTYVQTMQNPLDTEEKLKLYLDALMKVDVSRAIFYTRRPCPVPREDLFRGVLEHAKSTKEGAITLADFPFDATEEKWAFEILSRTSGPGLEALILRSTMSGDISTVIKLREKHGGGQADLNNAWKESLHPVEKKLLQQA